MLTKKKGSRQKEKGQSITTPTNIFGEFFRTENFEGTWTSEQLKNMVSEFNLLVASDEAQRKILLYRFFSANVITFIILDERLLVSKNVYVRDITMNAKKQDYQRKYPDEPALLASLQSCTGSETSFEINIEHLVKTPGFWRGSHRETLHTIPLSKITSIKLCPREDGFFDLIIETT